MFTVSGMRRARSFIMAPVAFLVIPGAGLAVAMHLLVRETLHNSLQTGARARMDLVIP